MSDCGWVNFRYDVALALPDNPHVEVTAFQLTDEGRILKDIGNVAAYRARLVEKTEAEIRRQQLNDVMLESNIANVQIAEQSMFVNKQLAALTERSVSVNMSIAQLTTWIAVATAIAAVYYMAELFDFYQTHFLSWICAAYFVSGGILGLSIPLLIMRLRKSQRKTKPDEQKTNP